MREIFHIFKKDVRRHWPEILISLVLLGLYVRATLQVRGNPMLGSSMLWFWLQLSVEAITPLMVIFWIFLTVRVVQGETLVGDRQWWVTKPYEWWKLLAAKEMFLVVVIGLPLFAVQLFFLSHAGFPIFHNLPGVLGMQFELGLILFLPSVALGSLTKGLGQALIGVLAVIVGFWGTFTLMEKVPNSGMSSAVGESDEITGVLVLASIVGAAGWQYARRRTWSARGLLVGGVAFVVLIAAVTPYAIFVERKYPVAEGSEAPARIRAGVVKASSKKQRNQREFIRDVSLLIPLAVSGIPEGHMVMLDGIRATVEAPNGAKWDPGWKQQWVQLWKEDQSQTVMYEIRRKEYESMKMEKVRLHIELALTEYQETEARELVLKEGEFTDSKLGICKVNERISSQIACRRPFHYPGLMASFDPAKANCEAPEDDDSVPEDKVTHAWFAPHDDDSPGGGLNPVDKYEIAFSSRGWRSAEGNRKFKVARLCADAPVRLATPEEKRHARVRIEMENVRLFDLAGGQVDFE